MNNNSPAKKDLRKAKYGSLSIAFTVVFVALIISLNLILSSMSIAGDLTVDLTKEDFTQIGEETRSLINAMGNDVDITIYFMAARDLYDSEEFEYNGVNRIAIIRDLALNYEKQFPGKIKVEFKELGTDPEFEQKYLEEGATSLSNSSIIVQGKYHFRILGIPAFYETDEEGNYYSFNGEYRFTSAILQSSISEPQVVTFTTGHGESPSQSLLAILANAGFELKVSNLEQDGIDPRTEILVCADPQTDFSESEIDTLTSYLAKYNSFILMVDSETPRHPQLLAMLEDYWGIGYKPMYRITDSQHSLGKEAFLNAKYFTIDSETASKSAAYQIHKTVSDMGGVISTVMPESVMLYARESLSQDDFMVEKVLTSYETARVTYSGEEMTTGEQPIMLLSTKGDYDDQNALQYSYVMLIGSTEFASDANLANGTYGNKRVLLAAARTFSAHRVAPDISSKPFGDVALDIELGTAKTLTIVICTLIPAVLLVLGVLMFLRRRHL